METRVIGAGDQPEGDKRGIDRDDQAGPDAALEAPDAAAVPAVVTTHEFPYLRINVEISLLAKENFQKVQVADKRFMTPLIPVQMHTPQISQRYTRRPPHKQPSTDSHPRH